MRYVARALTLGLILTVLLTTGWHAVAYGYPTIMSDAYDRLSTAEPSQAATHTIGFTITDTSQPLGSIELQFCSDSPLHDTPCTPPTGFDASSAVLSSQSGNTGFAIGSNSTANSLILTRAPATPDNTPNSYTLDNVTNPSSIGTYYLRIYIFPTTDGSGPETQYDGVALAINNSLSVAAQVPPYLKFCAGVTIVNYNCSTATTYTVNMGEFSVRQPKLGTSQFTVATNATSGYSVTVTGPTLTSGNDVIPNLTTPTPSLSGSSQFGINLRANNAPTFGSDPVGPGIGTVLANYDQPNHFMYQPDDTVVTANTQSNNQTFTVSYLTNINSSQPPGVYSTTITFVCLANF